MELFKIEPLDNNPKQPYLLAVDSLYLLFILILGFILRSYNIASLSLWIDEFVTTYKLYQTKSYTDFLNFFNAYQADQVPLSHLIYYTIFQLLSLPITDIEKLRWVSVFISTINLILFFIFVKLSFDKKTALWATLLLALSPFHILFAQMIRPYIFYEFTGLSSLLSTLLLFRKLTYLRGCIWILTSTLLFISHYMGVILIFIEVFFLTIYFLKENKRLFLLFPFIICVTIFFIFHFFAMRAIPIYTKADNYIMGIPPFNKWLTDLLADDAILTNEPFFHQGQTYAFIPSYWMRELANLHSWFDALLIFFSLFSILYVLIPLYLKWQNEYHKKRKGAFVCLFFPFWFLLSQPIISFLLTIVFAPILVLTILSLFIWPCMQTRYTLYCSFAVYALIAYTVTNIDHIKVRRMLLAWLLLAFSYQAFISLTSQKTTDFINAGKIISEKRTPDEPILTWGIFYINAPITNEILAYYSKIPNEKIVPVYSFSDTINCLKNLFVEKQKQSAWLVIERYVFKFPDENFIDTYLYKSGVAFTKTFLPGMNGLWLYHLSNNPNSFKDVENIPEFIDYTPFHDILKRVKVPNDIFKKAKQQLPNFIDFYHPPTPLIWNYLAWCALDRGEIQLAEWFARCAIDLQPQSPWGYHSLTISLMEQNCKEEALNMMEKCLNNDPTGIHKEHFLPIINSLYITENQNLAKKLIIEVEGKGGFVSSFYKRKTGILLY